MYDSETRKRILLTGGAGYIGSHTAVTLLEAGCDVVIIDNLSNSSARAWTRCKKSRGRPVTFHPIDLREQPQVEPCCAKNASTPWCTWPVSRRWASPCEKPLAYYDCNVIGTLRLLQAMQPPGAPLVFSSSATVYGDPQFLPYTEAHPTARPAPMARPSARSS